MKQGLEKEITGQMKICSSSHPTTHLFIRMSQT